jgi:hypothetical protein
MQLRSENVSARVGGGAWVVCAVVALALSGCVGGPGQGSEPTPPPSRDATAAVQSATTPLSLTLEGLIVYRFADRTLLRYEGDSPQFCFQMPSATATFEATLTWDVPQQMVLGFGAPGYASDPSKTYAAPPESPPRNLTPPLTVFIDHPEEGTWTANALPWAAGGGVSWRLQMDWEVARSNAPLDEIAPDDGTCFAERR